MIVNLADTEQKKRRVFLNQLLKSIGLATVGGIAWGGLVDKMASAPLCLRPPGALSEREFLAKCVRCGLCVQACPYDTLKLGSPGDDRPLGTPYFIPRQIPCYMCEDIPCVEACPSGSLDKASVSREENGKLVWDIKQSRMGIAVLDRQSCVAFWGLQCEACYRACPLIDQAINLKYDRNVRTGKHALLLPKINPEFCTGCGLCERACITQKPSIFVLPFSVAQGEVGTNYIKGWDELDENRLKGVTEEGTFQTERSKLDPVDYLNMDDLTGE
ncbi:ferredoxin-type protein NapG [candidate division LCP-89 bacterium B3_LCP]|uniref:Ferredoxin-type protein NapG n=1 Tax=candidate division LCP-89 bacterium B3_LCP TaxID=2012998 RepID=A0A532UU78_UNCL8|nr:MAG: ferredoxin-type protein NapG [candidate division LCP-89 bacterium B3_LCP]